MSGTGARHWISAVAALIVGLAVASCSVSAEPEVTSTATTTTQTAPSVWRSPTPVPTPESASSGPTEGGSDTTVSETLPGLTEDCSAALTAQVAVNDMIIKAMETPAPAATTLGSVEEDDEPARGILTTDEVEATFEQIAPTVPDALAEQLTVLHDATLRAAETPAIEVPDILTEPAVASALDAVAQYVQACHPDHDDQ